MDIKEKIQEASTAQTGQSAHEAIKEADEYFAKIREASQQIPTPKRGLDDAEERKMQDGFALEEMTKSAGWAIVSDILGNMPKANVDPRGLTEGDWKFQQLNAFWSGTVASELLEGIYGIIREAHELHRIKVGEVNASTRMKF